MLGAWGGSAEVVDDPLGWVGADGVGDVVVALVDVVVEGGDGGGVVVLGGVVS